MTEIVWGSVVLFWMWSARNMTRFSRLQAALRSSRVKGIAHHALVTS